MRLFSFIKILVFFALCFFLLTSCTERNKEETLIEQAARIHTEALTIDTHLDTPIHLQRDTSFMLDQLHDGKQKLW